MGEGVRVDGERRCVRDDDCGVCAWAARVRVVFLTAGVLEVVAAVWVW